MSVRKSQSTPSFATQQPAKSSAGGLSVFKTNTPSNPQLKSSTSAPIPSIVVPKSPEGKLCSEVEAECFAMDEPSLLKFVDSMLLSDDKYSNFYALVIAQLLDKYGLVSNIGAKIAEMISGLNKAPAIRDSHIIITSRLLSSHQRKLESFYLPLIPIFLASHVHKSAIIREESANICKTFAEIMNPFSFDVLFPMLNTAILNEDWRVKVGALNTLKTVSPRVSAQITPLLPTLIPLVTDCIIDPKKQVQTAGMEALIEACKAIINDDIRPLVPQLVSVIAHPDESIKTLDCLLETTFVANVDASVLALLAPLLLKSLKSRSSAMKRKASKVIDIMCRLVQDPRDVAPFMPLLLPALDKVIDEIVDEEVCGVAKEARAILLNAFEGKKADDYVNAAATGPNDASDKVSVHFINDLRLNLLAKLSESIPADWKESAVYHSIAEYLVAVLAKLVSSSDKSARPDNVDAAAASTVEAWQLAVSQTRKEDWRQTSVAYLSALLPVSEASDISIDEISKAFRLASLGGLPDNDSEIDADGCNLCNIEFSLAFGGKILLYNTHLKLGRGRRYGLIGKNGAGKTTLLTNIGSGNIEGLPKTLKTVYVQHDDVSDDHGVALLDELLASKDMKEANVTRIDAEEALREIGFTDIMLSSPKSLLSGGWKMKLLIIKAMLAKADVLLLDEPTNHLDAASVQWLTQYILSQRDITCLIVSHDTVFMDNVLTDVIHYEQRKLVYYHGNLTQFVKIHPEARYYHELEGSSLSFKFPTPERLEGINSTTRSIIKLENVTFTYPGSEKPQLVDVSVRVCLGSRIAVVGANGAGKSTLIKLMVQETEPDEGCGGTVWKHMNLRVAYVAQHSFHHVEKHLDSSPVDYIKWRFFGGVDREEMSKPTIKLNEEEVEEMKTERKYGDVDQILGRRKNGRTMEYECTFIGQNPAREPNKYIAVEKLVEMGYGKLVQQCDAKVAAMAAGLDLRPLLISEIQGHLNDFNLDSEFGTHSTIRRLSGGQKVKLVLAAAMWNRPHVLVLDEPTNYLDREALGALTQAIKEFGGGVVIISHNKEFTDAICTENWLVQNGRCYTEGEVQETTLKAASSNTIKKSQSASALEPKEKAVGNINQEINGEVLLNPKTLESLSKKEIRKLEKCAQVAGVSLKEYLSKINNKSPEWKWL